MVNNFLSFPVALQASVADFEGHLDFHTFYGESGAVPALSVSFNSIEGPDGDSVLPTLPDPCDGWTLAESGQWYRVYTFRLYS